MFKDPNKFIISLQVSKFRKVASGKMYRFAILFSKVRFSRWGFIHSCIVCISCLRFAFIFIAYCLILAILFSSLHVSDTCMQNDSAAALILLQTHIWFVLTFDSSVHWFVR